MKKKQSLEKGHACVPKPLSTRVVIASTLILSYYMRVTGQYLSPSLSLAIPCPPFLFRSLPLSPSQAVSVSAPSLSLRGCSSPTCDDQTKTRWLCPKAINFCSTGGRESTTIATNTAVWTLCSFRSLDGLTLAQPFLASPLPRGPRASPECGRSARR